jgi:hypothetical protein
LGNLLYENQRVEFNESGLREVAKIADGKFFRATDTKSLEQIYRDIDKLEKSTVSVKKISAVPGSISPVPHERMRVAACANYVVANDLEEIAVSNRYNASTI